MKNCLHCNQLTKNEKFCSRPCAASYNNRIHPKRSGENNCLECNAVIPTRKTWCSETCKIKMKANLHPPQAPMTEYTCKYCSKTMPVEAFYKTSKVKCRSCTAAYMTKRKQKCKDLLVKNAGGKCVRCGYSGCNRALHFHHFDPSTKQFLICQMLSSNFERLMEEVDKCILLCANCHFEKHDGLW